MKRCHDCGQQKDPEQYASKGSRGRHYKTCLDCRTRNRKQERERRKRAAGRKPAVVTNECADCGTALTPNRTVKLDGQCICYGCQERGVIRGDGGTR